MWRRLLLKWQRRNWQTMSRIEQMLRVAAVAPLAFAREFLGFFPDEAQARVLEMAPQFREIVLNCCRQWGKSTLVAVLLVHRMLTEPGALVLVAAPGARQSGQLVDKVKRFLDVLGIKYGRYGKNDNSALLPNGSAIVSLPAEGRKIRCFSAVSVLVIDEAAWVPDEVYMALLPTLATTNGDLIVLGTPWEKRGMFYRMMTEDCEGRLRYTGPVTECKRISEAFLTKERQRGDAYYRREFLCEFLDSGKYLIDERLVREAMKTKEEAWHWI